MVARQIDVPDNITAAQLGSLSTPEVRRIADEVNRACFYFYSNLSALERPQASTALTITPEQVTYALDTPLDVDNVTSVIEVSTRKQLKEQQYIGLYKRNVETLSRTGSPDTFYVLDGRLGFAPYQDQTYTYMVVAARKATRLTKAEDDLLVPEEYSYCVTDHAVGYLKKYHGDPDADQYIQRAAETFRTLQGVATAVSLNVRVSSNFGNR